MLFTGITIAFLAAIIAIFLIRDFQRKKKSKMDSNKKEFEEKKGIID
ncbi:MAG: hypothetical protein ABI172_03915 [Ginsengibacter sp.]|jgi:phosphotransferase system  glucose/maltose/N-acetylglucosamine-specific IIC component